MPLVGEIVVNTYVRTQAMVNGRQQTVRGPAVPWRATINPIPGDELATLPEGQRMGKQYRALSDDFRLTETDEELRTVGHLVEYEGQFYEVRDAQPYPTVIPHVEYRIRRLLPAAVPPPIP